MGNMWYVECGLSRVTFYMWNFPLTGKIYQQWILINNLGPTQ